MLMRNTEIIFIFIIGLVNLFIYVFIFLGIWKYRKNFNEMLATGITISSILFSITNIYILFFNIFGIQSLIIANYFLGFLRSYIIYFIQGSIIFCGLIFLSSPNKILAISFKSAGIGMLFLAVSLLSSLLYFNSAKYPLLGIFSIFFLAASIYYSCKNFKENFNELQNIIKRGTI
jgi:hypothetical protein